MKYAGSVFVVFTCLALALGFGLGADAEPLIQEGGFIETASALGYFLAVVILLVRFPARTCWQQSLLLIIFGLRELDFHEKLTTIKMTKSRFYISSEVPLYEKLIVIILILLLVYVVYGLVRRHKIILSNAFRKSDNSAMCILFGICFMVLSKLIDGIGRKLSGIGIELSNNSELLFAVFEEVYELSIPVYFLLAIFLSTPRPLSVSRKETVGNETL